MRWSAAVLAAAASAACLVTSEPAEQLDLSLTLSAVQVHADTGVTIRVSAVNRTNHVVRLASACPVGYDLVPPANHSERLYHEAPFCTRDDPSWEVGPGDSVTLRHHLSFRPQWRIEQEMARWPAGRYEVAGYLVEDGRIVRRTAPIVFDLICADPTWTEC